MYLNKVFIIGNITKDPELKALPSGMQVASFSVATNRTWKDQAGAKQEAVDFHNIVVFGKQAEVIGQYMKKGSNIFIEGRIQTRSWDGPDGKKNYRTEVIAERFQFGPKPTGQGGGYSGGSETKSSGPSESGKKTASAPLEQIEYPQEEINPEDIPF
ncbi:MAG: single-stranded DNA-binding protein [bacterium]